MKIVLRKTERYVVRCNTGYLGPNGETPNLEDAYRFEQRNKAERAIEAFRKRGWNALWVEELPRPFNVVERVR